MNPNIYSMAGRRGSLAVTRASIQCYSKKLFSGTGFFYETQRQKGPRRNGENLGEECYGGAEVVSL
jgi:hypothetical protein